MVTPPSANHTPRVRIAPSPTGDPHIGTAYIALFNYVFARKYGGKFILRIEDTDQTRYRKHSEAMILDALKWVGLEWDEGPDVGGPFGPYKQSERLEHYQKHAQTLIESGAAYRCFCTPERLDQARKAQIAAGQQTGYDRHCRQLSDHEISSARSSHAAHTVRMKMPESGTTTFEDGLRGRIEFENKGLDDFVLLKTDLFPTYHLASIVDDHLMQITHVIRGEEWISSTPKHVLLYQASNWEAPKFFHLPLLRNADKSKISKRKNPTSINYYKRKGILPETLRNFLSLMGWSMEGDREIFTTDEMIQVFDWSRFSLGGPVFDLKKLTWLNGQYLRKLPDEQWLKKLRETLFSDQYLLEIMPLVRERVDALEDFVEKSLFFFSGDLKYETVALPPKGCSSKDTALWLSELSEKFEELEEWSSAKMHTLVETYVQSMGLKPKDVFMSLRLAITGTAGSPPLFESIQVLGKEMTRRRMRLAIDYLKTKKDPPCAA